MPTRYLPRALDSQRLNATTNSVGASNNNEIKEMPENDFAFTMNLMFIQNEMPLDFVSQRL